MTRSARTLLLLTLLSLPLPGLLAAVAPCVTTSGESAAPAMDHSGHDMAAMETHAAEAPGIDACCDDCVSMCAGAGLSVPVLLAARPIFLADLALTRKVVSDALLPGPPLPALYRPPIASC